MGNKFRARLKRKLPDGRDYHLKDYLISYDKLKEGQKLKPPNILIIKKVAYLFDASAIYDFDNKNNPIIEYYEGNLLPIKYDGKPVDPIKPIYKGNSKIPVLKDSENNYIEVSGKLFDTTFNRGEMKNVIASSQKEEQKWDWKTLLIGALLGGAMGAMIMMVAYPSIFPHAVITGAITGAGH